MPRRGFTARTTVTSTGFHITCCAILLSHLTDSIGILNSKITHGGASKSMGG